MRHLLSFGLHIIYFSPKALDITNKLENYHGGLCCDFFGYFFLQFSSVSMSNFSPSVLLLRARGSGRGASRCHKTVSTMMTISSVRYLVSGKVSFLESILLGEVPNLARAVIMSVCVSQVAVIKSLESSYIG